MRRLLPGVVSFSAYSSRDAKLQCACLAITVLADYFLLLTDLFAFGICIFLVAHLIALARYRKSLWPKMAVLCTAIALLAVSLPALGAEDMSSTNTMLGIIYGVLILTVTICTFLYKQPKQNAFCSRLGMCLFLLCDLNVAMHNTLDAGEAWYAASGVLMWVFYLPAQILLSISAYLHPACTCQVK
jgi:uncharacterized membrane protein YhhN